MTTGTIPNFVDVLLNFGSAALSLDSFVHQMYERGKIVFLGDDTWTKLFPIQFHRQLENRDSLFVNDFYQGDQNITKSLHAELKHADWELLILHYLGLDHIGHVEGPYSNKVPGKLQEMDNVAMRINLELLEWVRLQLQSECKRIQAAGKVATFKFPLNLTLGTLGALWFASVLEIHCTHT